jgi:hypothetical protein
MVDAVDKVAQGWNEGSRAEPEGAEKARTNGEASTTQFSPTKHTKSTKKNGEARSAAPLANFFFRAIMLPWEL